jgi:hypothetical protein
VPAPCGGAAGCLGDGGGGGGAARCGGVCGTHIPLNARVSLKDLNNDITLDAGDKLNSYIKDDENVSHFFQTDIGSLYFDIDTFSKSFKNSKNPIFLSLNIQSLNSKYEKLKVVMQTLQEANLPIDVLLLQETWEVKHSNMLTIPGFQSILYRTREHGRGGGSRYVHQKWAKFSRKAGLRILQT